MPKKKQSKKAILEQKLKKIGINVAIILLTIIAFYILYAFTPVITNIIESVKNILLEVRRSISYSLGIGWGLIGLYCIILYSWVKKNPKILLEKKNIIFGSLMCVFSIISTMSLWRYGYGGIYVYGLTGKWGYLLVQNNILIVILFWFLCFLYNSLFTYPNGKTVYAKCINRSRQYTYSCIPQKYFTKFPFLNQIKPTSNTNSKNQKTIFDNNTNNNKNQNNNKIWMLPNLELLPEKIINRIDQSKIDELSEIIKESLSEHNVFVNIISTKVGSRIIRFGLEPGYFPGQNNRVKVSDITRRQKDLALKLKSPYVRIIEQPEPGEGLIGLEIPNPIPNNVNLRSILNERTYQHIIESRGLPFALGEDTSGKPIILDITNLPHLLIAGATGSGKSICINALLLSLLMSKSPNELELILMDPKRVELTPFNGIPHLNGSVIVDTDKVSDKLDDLIHTMNERYKLLESNSVRNILDYNQNINNILPYIVLVIDELSDLIMTRGKDVESKLVRLAQLGRAAGIHIILATQRPAVKVVTGQLKTNIPARISFAVASQVDSRVILDQNGAEKLMGNGDLLVNSNDSTGMRRGQGILVEDNELKCIKEFWQRQSS